MKYKVCDVNSEACSSPYNATK